MSLTREFASSTARGWFRDLVTTLSSYERISAPFHDVAIAANLDSVYDHLSERRITAQRYLEAVDWSDPAASPALVDVI